MRKEKGAVASTLFISYRLCFLWRSRGPELLEMWCATSSSNTVLPPYGASESACVTVLGKLQELSL